MNFDRMGDVGLTVLGQSHKFSLRLAQIDALQRVAEGKDLSEIAEDIREARADASRLSVYAPHVLRLGLVGAGTVEAEAEEIAGAIINQLAYFELHDLVMTVFTASLAGRPAEETGAEGKTKRVANRFRFRLPMPWLRGSASPVR